MVGVPGIPQNVQVQSANQQILVSWNLSTGATSYSILRSLDNVTYAPLATISGSPLATQYLDTAVILGIQYWYKVAAGSTVASISFTGQPNPGDTAIIDGVTFTAVTAAPVGSQFLIGSTVANTISNLASLVNSTIGSVVSAGAT